MLGNLNPQVAVNIDVIADDFHMAKEFDGKYNHHN